MDTPDATPSNEMPSLEKVFDVLLKYYGSPKLTQVDDPTVTVPVQLSPRGYIIEVAGTQYLLDPRDVLNMYDLAMALGEAQLKQRMYGVAPGTSDPNTINDAVKRVEEMNQITDLERQFRQS